MGQVAPKWRVAEVTFHPVRRAVLDVITEEQLPIHLDSIAADVAELRGGFGRGELVSHLHHVHLPKLAETGFVEYDATKSLVTGVSDDSARVLEAYEHWWRVYSGNGDADPQLDDREPAPTTDTTEGGTVIIDVDLPADQFALGDVVQQDPTIVIELERIVPLENAVLPFLWVSGGSTESVEHLLASSAYVTNVERLVTLPDRALYQLEWTHDVDGIIDALADAEGVIMEGHGTAETWSLRLRFTTHRRLKQFTNRCREEGIDLTIRAVYNPHPPAETRTLTRPQRETLQFAVQHGYFKVPRQVTLSELAEQFDVSEQAISQRIRRGLDNLVGVSLATELP